MYTSLEHICNIKNFTFFKRLINISTQIIKYNDIFKVNRHFVNANYCMFYSPFYVSTVAILLFALTMNYTKQYNHCQ